MQPEIWKPVVGHEGAYEVSNLGRVRSLDRVSIYERLDQYSGRTLTVSRQHKGKLLRPGRMSSGHLSVALGRGNSVCIHVLVLNAFIGPCPSGEEACHDDDIPSNNSLANLSWGSRSDNLHDAVRNGRRAVGERHRFAKLKDADIPGIRAMFGQISFTEIARRYDVSDRTIRQIRDGRTWKHVRSIAC